MSHQVENLGQAVCVCVCGLNLHSPERNAEYYRCRSGEKDEDACREDAKFVHVVRRRAWWKRWGRCDSAAAAVIVAAVAGATGDNSWLEASRRHDCVGRRHLSTLQHDTVRRRGLESVVRVRECAGGGGRDVWLDLNAQQWFAKCFASQPAHGSWVEAEVLHRAPAVVGL